MCSENIADITKNAAKSPTFNHFQVLSFYASPMWMAASKLSAKVCCLGTFNTLDHGDKFNNRLRKL